MAGTIGFGMVEPVINNRRNAWYQKRNAVKIPRRAICKKYLDAKYTLQGGTGLAADTTWLIDSAAKITELFTPSTLLPPASVTFVDETGGGGKKFMRVRAGSSGSPTHAAMNFNQELLGDGQWRMLFRNSGTAPAVTQTHGPCCLMRSTGDVPVTDTGTSYSLGHVRYSSTDQQRLRRLVNGVSTIINGLATPPPFAHNTWNWGVLECRGSNIKGYYYADGAADPGVFALSAVDATLPNTRKKVTLSFQGGNILNIDIAAVRFIK